MRLCARYARFETRGEDEAANVAVGEPGAVATLVEVGEEIAVDAIKSALKFRRRDADDGAAEELLPALKIVSEGGVYITPELQGSLTDWPQRARQRKSTPEPTT